MDGSNGNPAVELRGITKVFPGVVANDSIDLDLYRGEIHCLLGENGAGKSTLMQILSGMYRPDGGTIILDGARVEIGSPQTAIEHGIGMVYQHPTLVPTFTVLENLLLGRGGPAGDGEDGRGRVRGRFRLDKRGTRTSVARLTARLGTSIDADARVGSLALGRQQQVEIVKALWRGSSVLILDEPTAMLTPRETEDLASVLASLRDQGMALVVISHKLKEALALGDRVTVLRQGRVAGRLSPEDLRDRPSSELHRAIVGMLFGDEAGELARAAEAEAGERPGRFAPGGTAAGAATPGAAARADVVPGEVVLQLQAVSVKPGPQSPGLHEVSFAVRRGEVFGIAGVDGNGQRELAEVIAGQRHATGGAVMLGGEDVTRAGVSERRRLGLGYVTDDRLGEGIVASLPLSLNLLLKRIGEQPFWSRLGAIAREKVRQRAAGLIDEYDIRVPGPDTAAGTLSGGNIQKALLARELSAGPKVVVYNKPTHGLDFKTTIAIRAKIGELATRDGVAAVLISTDLDELVQMCDRVAVLSRGRLAGTIDNAGPGMEQRLGELMVGVAPSDARPVTSESGA